MSGEEQLRFLFFVTCNPRAYGLFLYSMDEIYSSNWYFSAIYYS